MLNEVEWCRTKFWTREREPGRKWGGRCTGSRKRGGGKRDSQGDEKRENRENYAIFRNISQSKKAKGREPTKQKGREPGLKRTGGGKFKLSCAPFC